ncbi:MAG: hypothetical protein NTX25_07885 [Proteobacteria bacterium]|nr:hypothetical protein [Pseudomonadota bacterium]
MLKDSRQNPKDTMMDESLQSFASDVGIVCALEAGGKITPQEAYKQIKNRWKNLKKAKKALYPKDKELDLGDDKGE